MAGNAININGVFQEQYAIPVNFADYSVAGGQQGMLEKIKFENDYLRNDNEQLRGKVRELEKKVQDQVLEMKRKDVELKNKDLELKAKQLEAYKRNAQQQGYTFEQFQNDPSQFGASCSKAGGSPTLKLTKKGTYSRCHTPCMTHSTQTLLTMCPVVLGQPYKRQGNHAANGHDISCNICSETFRTPADLRLHDIITHARKRVSVSLSVCVSVCCVIMSMSMSITNGKTKWRSLCVRVRCTTR